MDNRHQKNLFGKKMLLPCNHAPVVFHSNSCNFASFRTAIKSPPFGLRVQNFTPVNNLHLFFYLYCFMQAASFCNDKLQKRSLKDSSLAYKTPLFVTILIIPFYHQFKSKSVNLHGVYIHPLHRCNFPIFSANN